MRELALALLGGLVYFAVRHIATQPALPKRGDPRMLDLAKAMAVMTPDEVYDAIRRSQP